VERDLPYNGHRLGQAQLTDSSEVEASTSDQRREYRENRRLDGSRDYWQLREEGRFGSHPSFDSCDDESTP
jgi:hypothetical protein